MKTNVVILQGLSPAQLGINTFDEGAIELILCHAQGNLRLCRHLCYGSLVEACRDNKMTVTLRHESMWFGKIDEVNLAD